VRISPRLAIDPATMSPDEITAVVREGLLEQSGLTYVNHYAFVVKAKAERAARAAAESAGETASPQDA
jgi:ketosteroid isomerase-like protein